MAFLADVIVILVFFTNGYVMVKITHMSKEEIRYYFSL